MFVCMRVSLSTRVKDLSRNFSTLSPSPSIQLDRVPATGRVRLSRAPASWVAKATAESPPLPTVRRARGLPSPH